MTACGLGFYIHPFMIHEQGLVFSSGLGEDAFYGVMHFYVCCGFRDVMGDWLDRADR